LCHEVSRWQQALQAAGIGAGDRVAVYLPNVPEAMIILLAASNIGAVFASAGMEMGAADLINRFSQVKPKILITADGYVHGAKKISRKETIQKVREQLSSLEHVVVLKDEGAHEFLLPFDAKPLEFFRRDFNHPLYILFSSGSTGKPKCFEHSTGGVMMKHISEYLLHCDVHPGDRVFYHATPSWMMWNWLVGALATGSTVLLYDGSPAHPDAYAQWEFTTSNGCTHHGTAAPVILSWETNKISPKARYDLSKLRMVMSTGAVLPRQGFEFIHREVKGNVKIGSISGGTDIVGCFVGGNMFTPTYAGQINGPMLGCDVHVWNDEGEDVKPGEVGEMVCLSSFPSMPLWLADDPDGAKYEAEYFSHYAGKRVWRHGDSIEKTPQGQFVIIGRSDATLNQNGVRIGTVAIYDQLKPFAAQIKEAAAIDFSRPDNRQTITVLFLVLHDGASEVPVELRNAIKKAVKDNITPYAIPTEIIAVLGILKTPNGKIAEVVMKKIVSGKTIPNASLYGEDLVKNFETIGRDLILRYGG
jgi:acetoacetyl-CoA synthetase